MRRYVSQEVKVKKKSTRKKSTPRKRISASDLTDLMPESMRQELLQHNAVKPAKKLVKKPVIKKDESIDPAFINSRAPGSKVLRYRRSTITALYTYEDRLARLHVIDRKDYNFSFRGNSYEVIVWISQEVADIDVNIHLIDYNEEPEELKTSELVKVILVNESDSNHLLPTPVGLVCPRCKTNEFVKSDLKNMPQAFQQANWRNADNFGSHCEQCQTSSEELI